MGVRDCFSAKIAAGKVSQRAGAKLSELYDQWEREARARTGDDSAGKINDGKAAAEFFNEALSRDADLVNRTVLAQADILRGVQTIEDKLAAMRKAGNAPAMLSGEGRSGAYAALSSFLDADPHELATWNSAAKRAEDLAGRAHSFMADTIAALRSKALGFKNEAVKELDLLRAAFGRSDVPPGALGDVQGWFKANGGLADSYIAAGGDLVKRDNYFPNPSIDPAKALAIGEQGFKALAREVNDRSQILDFRTKQPMTSLKFEQLLDDVWRDISGDAAGRPLTAAGRGATMLANRRDAPRLFVMKDAEAWMRYAETVGEHASPYLAMVEHIQSMARDTALLEKLGPNPPATLRFMLDLLDRNKTRFAVSAADLERGGVARATRINQKLASRTEVEKKSLSNLFADVAGLNRVPVSAEIAERFAQARSGLIGAQLGSAMVSSLNDPGTLTMGARMAGLDVANVLKWTTFMLTEKNAEVFAAQTGFMMDTLAHTALASDKIMGDTVRSGIAAKIGGAVIRASGLRRWTEGLKGGFWLGSIAQVAHEMPKAFADLDKAFQVGLGRAGIGDAEWKIFQQAQLYEPRPKAVFLRPQDVAALGGVEAERASEKLAQYVNTFMDYAVIESTPRLRAMIVGDSRPGTISGELRRSLAMYRFFSGGLMYLHGARALARGWDGARLSHAALSFITISMLGAVAMQAKEVLAGRDPLSLDPTKSGGLQAWGKAILQGGGLGVFGDILAVDQTKYGNTWASTFAGPVVGAVESVVGDALLKNLRLAAQGRETHVLGDLLYAGGRLVPGSSLWYGKLAFQRGVLDQLAVMADPRAPERFARIEEQARKDWGQGYWSQPGRAPSRAPDFGAAFGR